MFKKGDTLIEVMLAVGIFSMVAVAVVAVMSNGTAGAQLSLETTLAREEIDAQAEALRFIQSSYIADKDTGDDRFTELWKSITDNAIDLGNISSGDQPSILQFAPSSCPDLYNDATEQYKNIYDQKAFIINTHYLGQYTTIDKDSVSQNINKVFISASSSSPDSQKTKFAEASTYPRLVFGTSSKNTDNNQLVDNNSSTELYKAEGIYVIAVKDHNTTNIVSQSNQNGGSQSAFYDFYIRTCWYGVGDQTPSTISTVVRLYDPKVVTTPDS